MKLLVALTAFNLVVVAAFSISQHKIERVRILDGLEEKLWAATTALPLKLPPGYLDRAVTEGAISDEEYLAIARMLQGYCDNNNLVYLYTYIERDGIFYCTSTNATDEQIADGSFTPYFDAYVEAPNSIFQALNEQRPIRETVSDRWGDWFTLFYPLQTAEGTRYVAGADVDIEFVNDLLSASLQRSLLLGVAAFIAILFISHYASRHFARAIQKLAAYTDELSQANFATIEARPLQREVQQMPARYKDEVGSLASAFLTMEERLGTYLRELTATTAAKERIENEIKLAGKIQADMLPRAFDPGIHRDRVDLYATMKPAREAGGDLYDYFFVDDDHLLVALGDVSGKGVAAALFMTVSVTILRANASREMLDRPDLILSRANRLLCKNNELNTFLTLFLGVLNVRTGQLCFADGGHNRPFLRRAGGSAEKLEVEGGIALGVFEEFDFTAQTLQMAPGDTLVLYTDGVNEATSVEEALFGDERFANVLDAVPGDAPSQVWVEEVMRDVAAFAEGAEQSDDIAILALRYRS